MILIIQNGSMETSIASYLDEPHELVKSYETNVSTSNYLHQLGRFSCIIILGGPQSATNIIIHENIKQVVILIDYCHRMNFAVLGICLGAQLIAHHVGCMMYKTLYTDCGYNTNVTFNDKNYDLIYRCHSEYIIPNDQIQVLSMFNDHPYIIKVLDSKLLGIQCHPDMTPESVIKYANTSSVKKIALQQKIYIDLSNRILLNDLINSIQNKCEM